ncbi:MAG: 16S rRNA (guanine(527)-N(7))-methyltransferase RsmG [Saprospiraceae bacterium]|nr:16S rRNA (guanine(527)-N(7))-methyltransferase RsmG [Saprospiraceae bacterium]
MGVSFENTVLKYFDDLSDQQINQLQALDGLYREWNQKVNVISRKDIDSLYLHHVLHSLSIAKYLQFKPETTILDLGTGGGFPGIPLSILFPECRFHLIDGKAKKIKVVQDIIDQLGLKNASCAHQRSEEHKNKYHFVLARAVTHFERLVPLCQHLISKTHINYIPNGLIALKGGDVEAEIKTLGKNFDAEIIPISRLYEEEYFDEKYIIYIQI